MQAENCLQEASSIEDFEKCDENALRGVDEELNRVYELVRQTYSHDKLFLEKLAVSQEAWKKHVELDHYARFPEENIQENYGSVYRLCLRYHYNSYTFHRILFLKRWLEGVQEGDVCSGSVDRTPAVLERLKKLAKPK